MPITKIDYSKTIIYKIVCNDDAIDYIYVGSTTDWTRRKSTHKSSCNNANGKEYNKKKYVEIRENGEWVNFQMLEIEKYPCLDNNEARSRKEVLRKELKANMNTIRAFRTDEEKKQDRIEYREENKNKATEYREANKDKHCKRSKDYYEANKEVIKAKESVKHDCPCGSSYTQYHKAHHMKTKKHKLFINNNNYIFT